LGDPENKKRNKINNVGAGLASAQAITLITLVITIVVLIILASIVIKLTLGENRIIYKGKMVIIFCRNG
jgi:type II secretory pathway pseudopilin PulG